MSSRPPAVLLVDPRDEIGGDSLVHLDLVRRLDRARFRPIVLCHDRGPLPGRYRALRGVEVWSVDCGTRDKEQPRTGWSGLGSWLHSAGTSLRSSGLVWRRAQQAGVRLVHASNMRRGAALGSCLARALRVPWVLHGHSVLGSHPLDRYFARHADRIACVSRVTRDAFQSADVSPERLVVIENAVDPARVADPEGGLGFRRRHGIPVSAPVLGWMGRLTPSKGPDVFLEAAAIVSKHAPEARFVLVGDAEIFDANVDYESELLRLARDLGIAERVVFTGFVDDVGAAYAAFDYSVITTRDEGFGLVNVESMLAELPIVAVRVGAVPEILEHERTALLVPPESPRDLAQALRRLISDPSLARRLASEARRTAGKRYPPERPVRAFEALYEELLEERRNQLRGTHRPLIGSGR